MGTKPSVSGKKKTEKLLIQTINTKVTVQPLNQEFECKFSKGPRGEFGKTWNGLRCLHILYVLDNGKSRQ